MEKTKEIADQSTTDLYSAPEETSSTVEELTTQNEGGAVVELVEPQDHAAQIKDLFEGAPHKFDNLTNRPYPMATFTWASTDAVYSSIYTLSLPEALLNMPQISRIWTNYWKFATWDSIEVSVQPNMAVGAQGVLFISRADCQSTSGLGYRMHTGTLGQIFALPGYRVSAGTSTTLTFELPWNHNHVAWDLADSTGDMHNLNFVVMHPLATSQGSAYSGEVTVWAKFNNFALKIPNPASVVTVEGFGKPKGKAKAKQEAADKSDNHSLVSTVSTVDQVLDTGIHIFEKLADVGMRIAPLLALLDKPTSTQAPMPTFHFPSRDMALISGLDWVAPLSSHPQATTGDSYRFAESQNPTIANIASTPSLMGRNTYSAPQGGDVLAYLAVSPFFGIYDATTDTYLPSWAQYAVSPFCFWRGGMKFQLNFSTSQFVSMKVAISYIYDTTFVSAPDNDMFGDSYTTVCDVLGDTTCEFTVPFVDDNVFARTDNSASSYYLDNSGILGPYSLATGTARVTMPASVRAYLVVHVLNKAVTNDPSISPVVYLDVWASMAEDFQVQQFTGLSVPKDSGFLYEAVASDSTKRINNLKGETDHIRRVRHQGRRFNSSSKGKNIDGFGERSVKCTLQRFGKSFFLFVERNNNLKQVFDLRQPDAISYVRRFCGEHASFYISESELEGVAYFCQSPVFVEGFGEPMDSVPLSTSRESFAKPFDYMFEANPSLDHGFAGCEENLDWIELGKRYFKALAPVGNQEWFWAAPTNQAMYEAISTPTNIWTLDTISWITYPFLWIRGSCRYRGVFTSTATDGRMWLKGQGSYSSVPGGVKAGAMNLQTASECRWQGIEQPFYSIVPLVRNESKIHSGAGPFNAGMNTVSVYVDDVTQYEEYFWALGDDFIAYQLMTPPPLFVNTPPELETLTEQEPLTSVFFCASCGLRCKDKDSFVSHASRCEGGFTSALETLGREKEKTPTGPGRPQDGSGARQSRL